MKTPNPNAPPQATFLVELENGQVTCKLDTNVPHPRVSMEGDDIRLSRDVAGSARLTFRVVDESLTLDGIQLGFRGQEELPPNIPTSIPFECTARDNGQALELQLGLPAVPFGHSGSIVYSFSLFVRDPNGKPYRHDPKIYNDGPGGDPPRPKSRS